MSKGSDEDDDINLLSLINSDDLMNIVLGGPIFQGIVTVLTILSYIRYHKKCSKIVLDNLTYSGGKLVFDALRKLWSWNGSLVRVNMVHERKIVRAKKSEEAEDWEVLLEDKSEDLPPPYSYCK